MAGFDLKEIYRNTFGSDLPKSITIDQAPGRREVSSLGQPYYLSGDPSRLRDPSAAGSVKGTEFFMPVRINGLLIPFAVVSMNWAKEIVATKMPERNGEVHEQISISAYKFNIKGLLIDDAGFFPEQGLIDMHDLFKLNAAVRLECVLTAPVFSGEPWVIINRVNWPAASGVEHVRAFEMELTSDSIFDLELEG